MSAQPPITPATVGFPASEAWWRAQVYNPLSWLYDRAPQYAYKPAATDRVSTTTMADDPDLTFQLAAGAVYLVEFHLFVGAPASGLMVTQWNTPAGATGLKGAVGPGSGAIDNGADNILMRAGSHAFGTQITYGRRASGNTNLCYAIESGTVATTSAGTCAVQWAQAVSTATATRMGLSSWARATRIA